MKKLIFLLLITTFIVVSFLSVKQFEFIQFQSYNHQNEHEEWNVIIEEGIHQKSKRENFELLENAAVEAEANLQRISYEKDENNKDKVVYYVVLYDASKYFENLDLRSGDFLKRNSDYKDFLSTVQTNNKHQIGQLEIFHSFDPIEIRPMIAAERTKDIRGAYSIIGENHAKKLEKIAGELGFTVKISNEKPQSLSTSYPYQGMMYIGSFVLCLLIMLTLLYDVGNNYKEVAVRRMLGYNYLQIGFHLLKRYIKIFVSSLIIGTLGLVSYLYYYNQYQQFSDFFYFWLKNITLLIIMLSLILFIAWMGTRSINIPQMIKNKKPIRMSFYLNIIVRFILAIFLVLGLVQGISNYHDLKSTISKQEKWSLLKDYSYLGVTANFGEETFNFQNDKEKRQQFQLLYKELESQGAIFISPSNYYTSDLGTLSKGLNPWGAEGRRIEVNENYLSINTVKDIHSKEVEIPSPNKDEITVLVPVKFKRYEKDIKDSVAKDYEGIYDIRSSNPVKVNIIYVENNQAYFTYSTNMAKSNNYEVVDPIAVIVNNKFDPMILANNISMGYGYYTKISHGYDPFKTIKSTLKKYDLDSIWQPVSIAYSNVELKIANDKEALQLTTIYCCLLLILAAVLLLFSAVYYLEMNKQLLSIQWIFGHNFFEKHGLVYLSILVFWGLTFMSCFFLSGNVVLLGDITIGLALFDTLLTSYLLSIKEYNVTKEVLIEK
ncbi:FtsX-like permease family protein [Bacillus amyloliquefaciens]|uniref:FtsX-like permease family protein n=1 Tax=Bacillus amyloliquefaciens TaxID=1390 RepID=UPI002D7FEA69|nr:DUF1430 domain-containing protein [Bacillus amyloliquefaciens]MEB4596203.1 DUF1430 domain-containing protein [Bacillus amyloliquefaciens]